MASFVTIQKNNLTKEAKTLEKINKETLADAYDRLNEEIALRGGYQSIALFTADKNALNNSEEKKVRVGHFNDAMQTRPYIITAGTGVYEKNKEEWYQQADKDKIETLIYDLDQGKTVINTGCANSCTGTCKVTCGGTAAA